MKIEGAPMVHRWITDECRNNKGDDACKSEVLGEVSEALDKTLAGWPQDSGVVVHVAVTVVRPKENKDEQDTTTR